MSTGEKVLKLTFVAVVVAGLWFLLGSSSKPTRPSIPPAKIIVPPESARTPEGARPKAPPPLRLTVPYSVQPKHIDGTGLRLIEGFEGFESCPYWDRSQDPVPGKPRR